MLRPVLAARRDLSQRKDRQLHETTSVGRGPQRRPRFRRPGVFLTAIGAATLLVAGCSAAFASSSPAPVHGHIYWTNGHWIGRARLSGTGVNQKFITGAAYGTGIAVSSGYLYWANLGGIPPRKGHGTIGRARLNGTDVNQKYITGASLPVGVTAAGGYHGTDVNQKYITTAQPNGPDGVVVGSGHIYWANDYGIGRANLNGTGVNQQLIAVPNGPSGVSGLAVNSCYIYWTDETAGTIGRARLNGTDVRQRFITGGNFPEAGLTLDSRYLYWANGGNGTIGRARLNGTGVNQRFIITMPSTRQIGLFGAAVAPGR